MCALARSIDDAELLRLTRGDLLADGSRLARTRKGRAPTPLRRRRRYPARASLRLAGRDAPRSGGTRCAGLRAPGSARAEVAVHPPRTTCLPCGRVARAPS